MHAIKIVNVHIGTVETFKSLKLVSKSSFSTFKNVGIQQIFKTLTPILINYA